MCVLRKLLLAGVVLAGLGAVLPAAAGAQVAVFEEATGQPCPDVAVVSSHFVTGGCRFSLTSEQESQIVAGTAGGPVLISTCEERFEVALDSNGEGYVYAMDHQGHVGGDPCTRAACDEAAPSHASIPWRVHLRENPDVLHVNLCLRSVAVGEGATGVPCELSIPWTQTLSPHRLDLGAESGVECLNFPPGAVEFFGHWHSEPSSDGTGIQVVDEEASGPCPEVTLGAAHAVTGGCKVRILGEQETQIVVNTSGGPVVISTCEDDLEAAFDSNGEGYVYSAVAAGHAMSGLCTRTACDEEDAHPHPDIPWRAHIRGEPGNERLDLTLCLRQSVTEEGTAGSTCDLALPISQTAGPHQMHIDAEAGVPCTNFPPGTVVFFGHWHTQPASGPHTELDVEHARLGSVEVDH